MEAEPALTRTDRDHRASCAHCVNTGITTHGGREWRCGCMRAPVRPIRTERAYDEFEATRPGEPPRQPDVFDEGSRTHACGVAGCPEFTTKKKPFCLAHLELIGHAERLKTEIAVREAEQKAVLEAAERGWEKVDVQGSISRDILSILETQGPQSVGGLARTVAIDPRTARSYVAALKKAGFVKVTVSEATSIVEAA